MTDQQHPITPPPELYAQWRKEAPLYNGGYVQREVWFMDRAAQWGADQELEACCEWLRGEYDWGLAAALRLDAERRPEPPPTLKEQALSNFAHLMGELIGTERYKDRIASIRLALEALPND